jgi:Effector-associated domain 10
MLNELDLFEQILKEKLPLEQVKSIVSKLVSASGDGSVAIAGGANGAIIITGKQNIVGDNNVIIIDRGIDAEELVRLLHNLLNPQKVSTQFQSLIADKTEGFVGREYVFDAIPR